MHEAAVAAADLLAPPDCDHLVVIPELELGGMRPDLWIGYFDDEQFEARIEARIEPCTAPFPLKLAYELRRDGGSNSIDRLCAPARGLGSRRRILRGLGELAERGIAARDGRGVELSPAWGSARARGVGVEAKVGRWRRAVRQVQMSSLFLNGAWLVFPQSYLSHFPRGSIALRSFGIAVVDGGRLQVVRRPRLRASRGASHALLEEHLFCRWRDEVLVAAKRNGALAAA